MDGSNMSVLDRVKMFLPQIEKANADLEKEIVIHGKDRFLIDSDLVSAVKKAPLITETHVNSSGEENEEADNNLQSAEDTAALCASDSDSNDNGGQVIELNFALGDFNDSAIALAEEQLIAAENDKENNANDDDDDDNED